MMGVDARGRTDPAAVVGRKIREIQHGDEGALCAYACQRRARETILGEGPTSEAEPGPRTTAGASSFWAEKTAPREEALRLPRWLLGSLPDQGWSRETCPIAAGIPLGRTSPGGSIPLVPEPLTGEGRDENAIVKEKYKVNRIGNRIE